MISYKYFIESLGNYTDNNTIDLSENLCDDYNLEPKNGDHGVIHHWSGGVYLQNCKNGNSESAVFLDNDFQKYYLVEEGFWSEYIASDGITNLGRPTSDEPTQVEKDHIRGISCQKFEHGRLLWDGTKVTKELGDNLNCNEYRCFSDIDDANRKYQEHICELKYADIIDGYDDGSYKPNQKINRAEFTKIVLLAKYSIKDIMSEVDKYSNTHYFSDIPRDETTGWYAKYVNFAKNKKIINGYPNGTFGGANFINFAESAKIIVKTLDSEDIRDKLFWELYDSLNNQIQNEDWYVQYFVQLAESKAIIYFNNFDRDELRMPHDKIYKANDEVTREQMAYIISKIKGL